MVYICPAVSYFCGAHIHTGKNRDRGRKLQSGDSDPDNGGRPHGLGDGISDKRPGRDLQHREKKLAVPDLIRSGYGSLLALLL